MNYSYPIPGSQSQQPEIFASNLSGQLGSYDKPLNAIIQLEIDYSLLPVPPLIASYSFQITPGGEPQLVISSPKLDATDDNNALRFVIKGGIAGRSYTMTINVIGPAGGVRSDVLVINVLGDDCGCASVQPYYPLGYDNAVSADGNIVVNTASRFFVSNTIPINANVLDRWYNTTTGNVFDFITNGLVSYWTEAGAGGGGGGGGGNTGNIIKMQAIAPDGVTRTFTLTPMVGSTVMVTNPNTLFVSVDGVWQEPTVQYNAVDNQIVFVEPPFADSVIFMLWFAPTS